MDVNYGSISGQVVEYGYTGTYTGGGITYSYVLTSHGDAHPNSIMAEANFATTQQVDIGVVTDFDSAKIVVDWQAVSDGQLWRQDINTLAAFTVNATTDTTATCTLSYRVTETGQTGTFDATVNIVASVTTTVPQSSPVVGTIVKDETTASIPFTYAGSDQTFFQHSTDGGTTWSTVVSPIARSGLSSGTAYSGQIRAVNTAGFGASTSYNFTTDAAVQPDTTKPVITPIGANPATVVVGGTYTDAGATATDNIDGSLGSVTGTGSVDTNTIGQYTITYPGAGVVDSAGNVAEDATRTVNVVAEDPWPFSKGIKHAATKNWEWGKRHPKTGMRTRVYK